MSGNEELHRLLYKNPNVEEVQALIGKYPDAVREKNGGGYLPLHIAVFNDASLEVLQLLIKENPDAVKEKDPVGNLPLHIAAEEGASEEVFQLLIKAYPDAVKEKDNNGDLPLHLAVLNDAPKEVLQLLIKAYPNAVKEKNKDGYLPIDNPQIKEIYDRVAMVVQNSMRSQSLLGDHAKGKDLLGVKEEAHAIADIIAFKDLQTPFVVGILGGWGSGKSFTFNLLEEHLKEIQKYNLASEVIKLNSPYVGHIYLIKFDVWTFAKGCLWGSLMNRILTELNDQLDLEAAIGPELLEKGVSVIELTDEFATSGDIEYLKAVVTDESVLKKIREWKPRGGNITKALIDATNNNYEKELKELAEKKRKLLEITLKKKQQLAWEDVTADFNTTFLPKIKKLLKDAYKQYAEENPDDPVPQTVDTAMNSMKQWRGMFGWFKRYRDLFWAGRLSPLWFVVFLSSLVLALLLPLVLDSFEATAAAIAPVVSGIVLKFNDAKEKLKSAQDVITEVASEMHLDKEQVQKAIEAANKAQLRSDNNDEEKQQEAIRDLNAEINSLEDRVWLREGDSLNKVVGDRLGSSNYEEHLGVVHQAQADLKRISDAMLSSNQKTSFPRGDPRIVLFIDDLDRCPPKKVVETLEAVQLLVKTKLFVVVLAIDAQYVTLCLEDEYQNVLRSGHRPSGLDYIEKIIQLPYRVSPISAEYMESYLQAQMNAKKKKETPKPSARIVETNAEKKVSDKPKRAGPIDDTQSSAPRQPDRKNPTKPKQKESSVAIPTEELEFTWEELQSLKDACVLSGVGPRSGRRLVNVFKLMKIIWYHRDQTPDEDTPHEVSMKEACVLILALCASNSRSVRREMCKVFARIEKATSRPANCSNLKDFIKKALGEMVEGQGDDSPLTMIYDEECNRIFGEVKWKDDKEWILVKNDLRLLRSFSFVGEYNE